MSDNKSPGSNWILFVLIISCVLAGVCIGIIIGWKTADRTPAPPDRQIQIKVVQA